MRLFHDFQATCFFLNYFENGFLKPQFDKYVRRKCLKNEVLDVFSTARDYYANNWESINLSYVKKVQSTLYTKEFMDKYDAKTFKKHRDKKKLSIEYVKK